AARRIEQSPGSMDETCGSSKRRKAATGSNGCQSMDRIESQVLFADLLKTPERLLLQCRDKTVHEPSPAGLVLLQSWKRWAVLRTSSSDQRQSRRWSAGVLPQYIGRGIRECLAPVVFEELLSDGEQG